MLFFFFFCLGGFSRFLFLFAFLFFCHFFLLFLFSHFFFTHRLHIARLHVDLNWTLLSFSMFIFLHFSLASISFIHNSLILNFFVSLCYSTYTIWRTHLKNLAQSQTINQARSKVVGLNVKGEFKGVKKKKNAGKLWQNLLLDWNGGGMLKFLPTLMTHWVWSKSRGHTHVKVSQNIFFYLVLRTWKAKEYSKYWKLKTLESNV